LVLVDGRSIVSPSGVPLEQERAKQTKPLNKWAENNGVKLYPMFEWTSEGDLVLNTINVDYKVQVVRVMGQNFGPENGMD